MSKQKSLLVLVFVVFGFGVSTIGASASAQSSGNSRAIHGNATGAIVGQIPPNGLELSTRGQASYLGLFTRQELLFLNVDGSFTGQIMFISANGDKLHANVIGQFISPTNRHGPLLRLQVERVDSLVLLVKRTSRQFRCITREVEF